MTLIESVARYFYEQEEYNLETINYDLLNRCITDHKSDCESLNGLDTVLDFFFNNNIEQFKEGINVLKEIPRIKNIIVEEGITSISAMQCSGMGNYTATIPSTIEKFEPMCFAYNGGYTILIPQKVTTLPAGFASEAKLKEITIPKTIKTIEESAFDRGIGKVTIEEGVERIEGYAFYGISHPITIPNSVQYVGDSAFALDKGHLKITIDNTKEFVDANWDASWKGNHNLENFEITYLR